MKINLILATLSVFASSCSRIPNGNREQMVGGRHFITPLQAAESWQFSAVELDVLEAAIRHALPKVVWAKENNLKEVYLSVCGHDPDPSFIARFSDHPLVVKPRSSATVSSFGFVDRVTGVAGVAVRIGALRWVSINVAEVDLSTVSGSVSGSGQLLRVEREAKHWTVTKAFATWAS